MSISALNSVAFPSRHFMLLFCRQNITELVSFLYPVLAFEGHFTLSQWLLAIEGEITILCAPYNNY